MRRLLAILSLMFVSLPAFASEAKDLQKTARLWQKKIGMAEWSITVKPVPIEILQELCPTKCMAVSTWNVRSRSGVMFILMRDDYSPEIKKALKVKNVKADQRDSVVHEMLHNIVGNMKEESAVRTITKALKP